MANIKIIDLPTGSPESTSFVEATQVDEQAASGRASVKLALNALGNYVAGQGASPLEYGNLETESTTLIGAANELHNTIGADAYDDTATYNTGDYCIYGGELYKCNDDNVTGAWDATKWDLTKVVDELGGGGGNADFIECTQAEYDAWEQGGTLDPDVMYFITDGQTGGGSLADLSDVNLTNPTDGQLLRYNGTSGKWENAGIINDTTASASSVYSSNKTDTLLSAKANASATYTKSQVDTELGKKQDKLDGAQLTNTDLNTLRAPMTYYLAGVSSTNHAPVSDCWGIMEVVCGGGNNVVLQRITTVGNGGTGISQYERLYFSRTWTVWKTITRNIS